MRYATLAASSHNTQFWKFKIEDRLISILPELSRRLPMVDPDDHHLLVSLGCTAETLVLAALAYGMRCDVRFDAGADGAVKISMKPAEPVSSALFEATPKRQCTRAEYDGKQVPSEHLRMLEQASLGDGVSVLFFTE